MRWRSAPSPSLLDRMHNRAFGMLARRNLLYNACWEDPLLDRVALDLDEDDRVVVIASAGCNALDYVLAGAGRVDAVDTNPCQVALLELKLAGIRSLSWHDFFDLFGRGGSIHGDEMYHDTLRRQLSPQARRFWDRRLGWICGATPQRSLYWRGFSGLAARLVRMWIDRDPALRAAIDDLLAAQTLDEQRERYDRVSARLWTPFLEKVLRKRSVLTLLGVPSSQRREIERSHEGGIAGFIRSAIDHVFRDIPLKDNYFWRVYLTGSYAHDCCPSYLTRTGFYALKAGLVDRVHPHVDTITDFLEAGDEPISRFVLLDHMDWMSWYAPDALGAEWTGILRRATPDARVIFRSASPEPRWLRRVRVGEDRVVDRLHFDRDLAESLHHQDRVGTYASFHIAHLVA